MKNKMANKANKSNKILIKIIIRKSDENIFLEKLIKYFKNIIIKIVFKKY